jgi:hypothetical protein
LPPGETWVGVLYIDALCSEHNKGCVLQIFSARNICWVVSPSGELRFFPRPRWAWEMSHHVLFHPQPGTKVSPQHHNKFQGKEGNTSIPEMDAAP